VAGCIFISIFQAAFEVRLVDLHQPYALGGNFRVSERRNCAAIYKFEKYNEQQTGFRVGPFCRIQSHIEMAR
jgi:hypothetical protein